MPGSDESIGAIRWARLPLQAVLILWAWWYTGSDDGLDPSA
jgi:uncharacterized membrane protein